MKRWLPHLNVAALLLCYTTFTALGTRTDNPVKETIAFPRDEGVLDLRRDFGAKGDGVADDTAALQAAIEASSNRGQGGGTKILFLPNGVYRVTSNLVVKAAVGPWVYGESRDGVVIRLADGAPTNVTAVLRTHPSDTQASSADFFMRNFRHLTIDVGRNPHADGIRWYGNNSSILQEVRVIGTGKIGVNAGFLGQNGPSLVQDTLVEGSFETGVRCAWSWGQTLSRVTVRGAKHEGISVNATAVGLEDLVVENTPVALRNEYPNDWTWWGGVVALVGGRFTGGDPAQPAITNRSVLYARDVRADGFKQVLDGTTPGGSVSGNILDEYLSHPVKRLFSETPDKALKLPVKPEPRVPWETNLANWVCANDHGAKFGDNRDDTTAIQAAIDAAAAAGKTVVYLRGIGGGDPNWYSLDGEVRVHGSVRLIIGLGFGRVISGDQGRFIVDDRSAPVVKFLHLQAFGGRPPVVENRSATNTLMVESCDLRIVGSGGGDIFVTDCPSRIELRSPGQSLWARQLNPEGDSDTGLVQNHGGRLWALGVKHEGRGVRFLTDQGGQTEILGLFNYAPDIAKDDQRPAFDVVNADFSAAGVREMSFGNTYPVKARERRGEEVRTEKGGGWIGWALFRGGGETAISGKKPPSSMRSPGDSTEPTTPAPRPLPRLKVADNQRFLVTQDGQPFFWLGDTAWELFHRLDRAEVELYLRDRAQKGFTVIQAVALSELDGLTEPNRQGHLPLLEKDPARPDVTPGPANDYWDFVDEVLDLAAANGLYVGLLPTWGRYVTSSPFDGKVDGVFNVTNAFAYGRFLGERHRRRTNLIWILGGDKAPSTPEAVAIWRAMAQGITLGATGSEDPDGVLMTYHTSGPGHVSDYLHDETWLDFTSAQSSHGDLVESWRFIEKHWNRPPIKPVIDLESSYPSALIKVEWLPEPLRAAHHSTQPATDDHARRAAYWAVFAGAFGHTYGHNAIWQMYAPPRKPILDPKLTWREALNAPSAAQMGYLRALIESRPFLTQAPDQSLIADDAGSGPEHIRALRGNGYALIYTPTGKPFGVRLDQLPGPRLKTGWFDPRTGKTTPTGQFASEGDRVFTPPGEPGVGNDWVLVFESIDLPESLALLARKVRPDFLLGSFASGLNPAEKENRPLADFFRRNFNIMTVGVYMQSTQPRPEGFELDRVDALVDFARQYQLQVHLHPLIGGAEYTPKWVNEGGYSAEALLTILRARIQTLLKRYRGRVHYADVVNEALTGTGRKADGRFDWQEKAYRGPDHVWMKTLGLYQGRRHQFPRYLVEAFRCAREAGGPELKLILNEWGNETTNSLRGPAFLDLIQALREEGVPVDGAGLQLHCRLKDGHLHGWASDAPFDFAAFDAMLELYEQAGIEVHITEFDIHLAPHPTPRDYELQGEGYAQVLRHALKSPAVKSFKTWGFTDRHSWKADGQDGHPLLLDERLQPKPAYLRQIEILRNPDSLINSKGMEARE